jgi:hypothetical protein
MYFNDIDFLKQLNYIYHHRLDKLHLWEMYTKT